MWVRLAVGAGLGASPMYSGPGGPHTSRVASPAHTATPQDFSLPSLHVRLVARRAALPPALAEGADPDVLLAGRKLQESAAALARAVSADARCTAAAPV